MVDIAHLTRLAIPGHANRFFKRLNNGQDTSMEKD